MGTKHLQILAIRKQGRPAKQMPLVRRPLLPKNCRHGVYNISKHQKSQMHI